MAETKVKPPTQSVGVEGFKSDIYPDKQLDDADELKQAIDWQKLIHLPKFQMFAIEITRLPVGTVMEWIIGYIQDRCYQDPNGLFNQYKQWHEDKGYWKNETVFGELIEDK